MHRLTLCVTSHLSHMGCAVHVGGHEVCQRRRLGAREHFFREAAPLLGTIAHCFRVEAVAGAEGGSAHSPTGVSVTPAALAAAIRVVHRRFAALQAVFDGEEFVLRPDLDAT